MDNIVGLDWDNISLKTAHKRQNKIEENEKASTLLYKTAHGYHLEIVFRLPLTITENFKMREKYHDCKKRLMYSKLRLETTGSGNDILFNMKEGTWRKLLS